MDEVLKNPLSSYASARPLVFSVVRVPFFLEPQYDERKPFIETNRERLIKKWGGPEGWEAQKYRHNLKGRGMEAGIPHFNLDRLVANTMASHRLIQHIGKTYGLGVSEAVYDLLNEYYFVDGHSLNDKPLLARVVAGKLEELLGANSMTEEQILQFLDSDVGRKEIEHATSELKRLGVYGIPKFIIEGSTVVDGAATYPTFVDIFREIECRGFVKGDPIFREILGVSDDIIAQGSYGQDVLAA